MQFLYPSFLFALAALAIPIVIHLFYFRRFKKVYFTNVRFLKEVKEETSARQKLRNLLVLLMRCLAIAMLVFAFAQPFIPKDVEVRQGENAVGVFIDNSFSMSALSEDAPLIEKARQRAREIVNAYSVEDRFQILTNDFEGRHQRLVSKEEALNLIDEIKISPAVRTLSYVLNRQQQVLAASKNANKISYVISDFQASATDPQNYKDSLLQVNLVPLQAVQERNVSIDSAWFEAPIQLPGQPNTLMVKLKNWSDETAENIRLSIKYDGEAKPVGEVSIPANASIVDTVAVSIRKTGWHEAELTITDYPVQFDDHYYFAFNVAEAVRVLVIDELTTNPFLDAAFDGAGFFKVTHQSSRNLDYSGFPGFQLIVCNGLGNISSGLAAELKKYLDGGGKVVVFPAANAGKDSYNELLRSIPANELLNFEQQERIVSDVNTAEFIFRDVFENKSANLKLPVTQGNFRQGTSAATAEEQLLTYRDGQAFLSKFKSGQGLFYFCSAPLDENYSNLARSGEVFIPMLYKMAISSAGNKPIAYVIARDEVVETDVVNSGAERIYRLRGSSGEFIPEQRSVSSRLILGLQNKIPEAGFYDLVPETDTLLSKFAFNHDRRESDLSCLTEEELEAAAGDNISVLTGVAAANFEEVVSDRNRGIVLWKVCIWMALLALAAEVLLLRYWKT
ncbi:MAG: hypothetical protein RI973_2094 [Bacteroidota bacterium]|jgi:hypothetical protein